MKPTYLLLTTLFFLFIKKTGAVECENGWVMYKDELCIQTFPFLLTYNEAKSFCAEQGNQPTKSTLVMVKEAGLQDFLVNYTNNIYDNMWLGARYDEDATEFQWEDGTPLTYTNWMEGSPRNDSTSNVCIEMKPVDAKLLVNPRGKWLDVNCNKRNRVICQRALPWTLEDAVAEIMKMRRQLQQATDERNELAHRLKTAEVNILTTQVNLQTTQETLERTQEDLELVTSRVVPVGSIYVEFYNQPSPRSLWPELTWQDVTSTYAGLFFRASGGSAASWGTTQADCAPRITQVRWNAFLNISHLSHPLNIPANGVSNYGWVGNYDNPSAGERVYEGMQFTTAGCEVRPVNQAVRIWKRTA